MKLHLAYETAATRGQQLWAELQTRLQDPAKHDIDYDPLTLSYYPNPPEIQHPDGVPKAVKDLMDLEGIDKLNGWAYLEVLSEAEMEAVPYSNHMSARQGIICCHYADKELDTMDPSHRLERSQILGRFWIDRCLATGTRPSSLRVIIQPEITNTVTRVVLGEIQSRPGAVAIGKIYTEYLPGTRDFFALLGSKNGGGIARMLKEFCGSLGHKTIHSRAPLKDSQYMVDFEGATLKPQLSDSNGRTGGRNLLKKKLWKRNPTLRLRAAFLGALVWVAE
jgi:hypothetical protein